MSNLLRLTEKYSLKEEHMAAINKHLSSKILEYLQKKYPLTQGSDVNKALEKELQQTNNLDLLENDFLFSHGIIFKYREKGNYNDIIMRALNKAMEVCEEVAPSTFSTGQSLSNFQDFEIYMADLFEKTYTEEWVHGFKHNKGQLNESRALYKEEEQREKYKEKVKEYTSYMIKRKISCNTPTFSEQEINGQNLVI